MYALTYQLKATTAVAAVELEAPIYKHYEDDKIPKFPAKFPCGRIPAFEGTKGFNLTEGTAITWYTLAEGQLHGFSTPEAILLTCTYLVDECLTIADIAIASVIFLSVLYTLDAPLHSRYPNVLCHLDLIINQPKLKDIFGQPTFIEKPLQYTPPTKQKKEKEPKQSTPAPAPRRRNPRRWRKMTKRMRTQT
ncbi:glutathione S-transferase C-terminal-like protein [Pisolithus croceorrhizus]|nr:glutathione S-transferase C-terminal-like protein [Pisolithus croceorrhizus]KAI6126332.1 glutathione S-transferase C-terminal-like protein [Pisolithus croceorrhizus]